MLFKSISSHMLYILLSMYIRQILCIILSIGTVLGIGVKHQERCQTSGVIFIIHIVLYYKINGIWTLRTTHRFIDNTQKQTHVTYNVHALSWIICRHTQVYNLDFLVLEDISVRFLTISQKRLEDPGRQGNSSGRH